MQASEVVIVGAGVVGVSLAYHLAERGIKSIILEKEPISASHASGKNAGMLRQLYRNPQLTDWATRTINEMPAQLKEEYFIQTGSIVVGRTVPEHHQELFTQDQNSVRCKTDGLLDSGPFVQALLVLAKAKGVQCFFNKQVQHVEKINESWQIKTQDHSLYNADLLVNASGAWANTLNENYNNKVALKAYARHLAVVTGFPENYMPAKDCGFYWDEAESWYMRLWDKTSRLVSICDENACEPDSLPNSSEIKEKIANTLLKHLPEIAYNLRIGSFWHCYRTYTEDRLPVIGKNDDSFFWLSGFGGFGMSTSYAATQDAARLITGEVCPALSSFNPSRCNIF